MKIIITESAAKLERLLQKLVKIAWKTIFSNNKNFEISFPRNVTIAFGSNFQRQRIRAVCAIPPSIDMKGLKITLVEAPSDGKSVPLGRQFLRLNHAICALFLFFPVLTLKTTQ